MTKVRCTQVKLLFSPNNQEILHVVQFMFMYLSKSYLPTEKNYDINYNVHVSTQTPVRDTRCAYRLQQNLKFTNSPGDVYVYDALPGLSRIALVSSLRLSIFRPPHLISLRRKFRNILTSKRNAKLNLIYLQVILDLLNRIGLLENIV